MKKPRIITYHLKSSVRHRIYVATDIHYESGRPLELLNIIFQAQRTHPDSIIIAGDTINYLEDIKSEMDRSELYNFFQMLSSIAPVYVCLGNHDQMHKDRKFNPDKAPAEQKFYLDFLRSIPKITVVHDRKVKLKKGLNLIGLTLPRDAYQRPGSTGTPEPPEKLAEYLRKHQALLKRKGKETNLLFVHSPRRFTKEILDGLDGIDYVISGHMHQGCIPFGLDEKLPGTLGLVAPGYAPLPRRARHTYPKYSDKLIVLPAYKSFAGWHRIFNPFFKESHTILDLK